MSWFGSFPICTWVFLLLLLAGCGRIIECVQQETVLGLGHSRVRNVLLGGKKIHTIPPFCHLVWRWREAGVGCGAGWSPGQLIRPGAGKASSQQGTGRHCPVEVMVTWVGLLQESCGWWQGLCESSSCSWFGVFEVHKNTCLTRMQISFPPWMKGLSRVCWLPVQNNRQRVLKGEIVKKQFWVRPEALQGAFQIGSFLNQMVPGDDTKSWEVPFVVFLRFNAT